MLVLTLLLWLAFNGRISGEILLLGLAATLCMGLLMKRLFGYTPEKEIRFWRIVPLLIAYALCLAWEIFRANCAVARAVWDRSRPLRQTLVTMHMDYRHSLTRYLFANSITLTPGTVTVRTEGDRFVIHCLSDDLLDGVESGAVAMILGKVDALL